MKYVMDKKKGMKIMIPETPLEAVNELSSFFTCDMWYAKNSEWKTEKDMLKYLREHFKICKEDIKRIMKEKNG